MLFVVSSKKIDDMKNHLFQKVESSPRGFPSTPQTLNRYTYTLNNPLKYTDPSGLLEDKFSIEGDTGGEEAEEEVEEIDPDDFEKGKYFENDDGDGFIYLESPIEKCGNVGVAIGSLHEPGSSQDPDHGLVIIYYDDYGNIIDIDFISFTTLLDETSGVLKDLIAELDEKGLKDEFKIALQALEDYCDSKQVALTIGGFIEGIIATLVGKTLVGAVGA